MIATGEATLTHEDLTLRANRIVYHEEKGAAQAEGNIRFSQNAYRLIAENLRIDLRSRVLEARKVRFGSPPIYAEAEYATGDHNRIELRDAQVYYREPDRFSPKIRMEKFVLENGEILMGEGIRFEMLGWPIWYLPKIRIPTELEPLRISTNLGRRGNLGEFFRSQVLFPLSDQLFAGGNFDYYGERGLLLGPALALRKETETSSTSARISSGFIRDGGDRGVDIFARPVPRNRRFITGDYRHHWAEENQLHGVINLGSDPEIIRDFHYDRFFHNQQPDNFLEFIHQKPNWTFSAMARMDPNDYYHPPDLPPTAWSGQRAFLFEEKLPQVSFDLHPTHLAGGIYQEMRLSASQNSHTFFLGDLSRKEPFTVLDGFYRLSKNVAWNTSTGLQFFAGMRWVDWRDVPTLIGQGGGGPFAIPYPQFALTPPFQPLTSQAVEVETRNFSQVMGDIGFNWEARYSRSWQLQNRVWNIDGLKHVVKPYLQMRHNPASQPSGLAMPEGMVFARDTNLPNWDLATRRDMVFAQEQTLARIGLKNQVFTRRKDYGSRELTSWNLAADYFFAGPFEDHNSFLYSEFSIAPAHWLEIGAYTRFSTDNLQLRELNSQIRIQDSDHWYIQYTNTLTSPNPDLYLNLNPDLNLNLDRDLDRAAGTSPLSQWATHASPQLSTLHSPLITGAKRLSPPNLNLNPDLNLNRDLDRAPGPPTGVAAQAPLASPSFPFPLSPFLSAPQRRPLPFPQVDQHSLEIGYKLNEKFRLLAWLRYDFVLDDFSEQHYSLFQKFGRSLEVEYRLSLRENALREDGWAFRMALQLLSF